MAEDNSARYRPNDSFGRAQAQPATDPLAELARLIGHSDPRAAQGRDRAAPGESDPAHYDADPLPAFLSNPAHQPHRNPAPPPYAEEQQPTLPFAGQATQHYADPQGYADPAQRPVEPQPTYPNPQRRYAEPAPQPGYGGGDPASRYGSDFAAHNDWPGEPSQDAAPSYEARPAAPGYAPQGYSPQAYPGPAYPSASYPGQAASPAYGNQAYGSAVRPGDGYAPQASGLNPAGYGAPPYPHDPGAAGMPEPQDDEYYDDEPHRGRRKGLLTVFAVLGLAFVGTAGAFGYRTMFGATGPSGPAPIIRASSEPTKVAPPPAVADASPGKFSYDRFSDAGKDEKVVKREEQPVDLSKIVPPQPKPGTASVAGIPSSAIGEPRRVHTVPIRPDQGDNSAASAPMQQPSQAPTATTPQRQISTAQAGASAQAADDAAARAAALRATARPTRPAPAANAPLSLSPDANNAPVRQAAPPATRLASAPPKSAPAQASASGSFLVQVSSQRSEADAESAYRGIQSKFGNVLGGQPHQVRKADLGAKGIYYRAMVGPFGTREAAVQLCSSLKQAGGDCVVQH